MSIDLGIRWRRTYVVPQSSDPTNSPCLSEGMAEYGRRKEIKRRGFRKAWRRRLIFICARANSCRCSEGRGPGCPAVSSDAERDHLVAAAQGAPRHCGTGLLSCRTSYGDDPHPACYPANTERPPAKPATPTVGISTMTLRDGNLWTQVFRAMYYKC